ncbi:MAG: molecular chaperone [Proteobacteria bacterium]|nr:molecular chaperone [Pseudomonadota bacterium]
MGTTAGRWRGRCALALAAWLAAAVPAAAGSFALAPIRIEMDRSKSTGVLTLHNDADAPVTIQVEAVAWSQPDDTDHYQPSRDLIVTPPVFVVAPKSEQIVRVARRTTGEPANEASYRLFFQEVPDSTPQSGNGLKVALRVGVPVFIAASGAKPEVTFAATREADGAVVITAVNAGRAHLQITDFEVTAAGGAAVGSVLGSRYLLPGSAARWTLKPSGAVPAGPLKIHGHGDHGEFTVDVALPAG